MKITIVVGNPKPASRTLQVAEALVDQLVDSARHDVEVIDLCDHAADMFAWPSERMAALNERVASSDLAVFASPTYKATYTGLLKAFLDRYPAGGLTGVTAIPVLTGADLSHSMGATSHLVPLLLELGAIVPGRGLYFVSSNMDRLGEVVAETAAQYTAMFAALGRIDDAVTSSRLVEAGAR